MIDLTSTRTHEDTPIIIYFWRLVAKNFKPVSSVNLHYCFVKNWTLLFIKTWLFLFTYILYHIYKAFELTYKRIHPWGNFQRRWRCPLIWLESSYISIYMYRIKHLHTQNLWIMLYVISWISKLILIHKIREQNIWIRENKQIRLW